MKSAVLLLCVLVLVHPVFSQAWRSDLDSKINFYQNTDLGIVFAGTEKSLYGLDSRTGERLWRRSTGKVNQTGVTPVPDTDVVLFTRDEGSRSRLEAVDIFTGARLWESDKVKGDVMQLAVDPAADLVAVVMARDARGEAGRVKKTPTVHVLRLSDGDELWKRDLNSSIEMMPVRFAEGDVDHTLDNYRAPLMIDGRLFLFYEGATSYDARTGKEKEREKFKINEDGLALTEADPVIDGQNVYVSGKGKIRAVSRQTGKQVWEASDLGTCSEMAILRGVLYVRTGGQFTRITDGEIKEKGPFGVSAIDIATGKTIWRYKGADKGLTNFVFVDERTIALADRDDLITISAVDGKRIAKRSHRIKNAQFILVNERRHAVVGGREEIAAFDSSDARSEAVWRVKHTAPGRGVLRVVAGIALRAAAIYFRYGGVATSALSLARTGVSIAGAANGFRWSGLQNRFGSMNLSTLAGNAARNYAERRLYSFGSLGRNSSLISRLGGGVSVPRVDIRGRLMPARADVQESILDRLDPVRQAERLSDHLLRRKRLAELRSNYMYFYTDLPRPNDGKGLVGVNVHTGSDDRFIRVSDPDPGFLTDESSGLLFTANGSRLTAFNTTR